MKQLDPKAKWLFFWSGLFTSTVSTFFIWLVIVMNVVADGYDFPGVSIIIVLLLVLAAIPLNYIWSVLVYNNFKYEITEDAIRLEKGVIAKKYVSIPYDRIQNIDILRGPLLRILGLSDLQIQTAGMSYNYKTKKAQTEGRLPGLLPQDAEELRNALILKTKESDQGV